MTKLLPEAMGGSISVPKRTCNHAGCDLLQAPTVASILTTALQRENAFAVKRRGFRMDFARRVKMGNLQALMSNLFAKGVDQEGLARSFHLSLIKEFRPSRYLKTQPGRTHARAHLCTYEKMTGKHPPAHAKHSTIDTLTK